MDGQGQMNWENSQQIRISVDLVTASFELLRFLAAVDRYPELYGNHTLERAIERYKRCWLPLIAAYGSCSEAFGVLVPPLDCAWVWHCHRLNPVQYAKDCQQNWGRILDAPVVGQTTADITIHIWKQHFPNENYNPLFLGDDAPTRKPFNNLPLEQKSLIHGNIMYNLLDAASRQRSFYYQVSQPYFAHIDFLRVAEQRYKAFLYLIRMHSGKMSSSFFVPTYDIDLMWHAHQLSSVAYVNDTQNVLGFILDHDDTDGNRERGQKLDTSFRKTREYWERTFGFLYERAGVLFKGDGPSPIPSPDATVARGVARGFPVSKLIAPLPYLDSFLTQRQTVQVYLFVYGTKCVPAEKASYFRLCVTAVQNCKNFTLQTVKTPAAKELVWNKVLTMECELSTVGLRIGLQYKPRFLLRRKKFVGVVSLKWAKVLNEPGLALDEWFPLSDDPIPPKLHIGLSITPPVIAPYLFRGRKSRPVGDDLKTLRAGSTSKGLWMTRTILDHTDREVFLIRIRNAEAGVFSLKPVSEGEVIVHVHKGGWDYKNSSFDDGRIFGESIGIARQLTQSNGRPLDLTSCRMWSLFDDTGRLTIGRNTSDINWNLSPIFELEGNFGYPIRLIHGRRLQYEVRGATEKQEAGFVTLIRYTPDVPTGKATALFNWRSAYMEVSPEENVVLVLLLSSTIALSMADMLGKKLKPRGVPSRRRPPVIVGDSGWGGIALTAGFFAGEDASFMDQDGTTPYFLPWWDTCPDSCSQNNNGAACGGGVCGGGACGGVAAASGGACGGGCGAGACGGGGGGCGGSSGGGCGGGGGGCGGGS